jgi:glutaredoxin
MQVCPKCHYTRKPADTSPEWQCPSCGIAYAKFAQVAPAKPTMRAVDRDTARFSWSFRASPLAMVAVVAIGYFAYKNLIGQNFSSTGEVYETDNPALVISMERGGPVARLKPEISAQLAGFTEANVVLYATSWCPYCAKTRKLFADEGIRYVEFDIERDHAAAEFQERVLRANGVPTIVIGNRVVFGFDKQEISAGLKEL